MLFDKRDGNAQITAICVIALVVIFMILLFGMMSLQTEFVHYKTNECFEEALLACNCHDVTVKNSYSSPLFSCNEISHCNSLNCSYNSDGIDTATLKAYTAAKKRFEYSIRTSLSLDAGLLPKEDSCLEEITLSDFRIYNVTGSDIWECDGDTVILYSGGVGIKKTPDEQSVITRSGVYAEINYKISGFTAKSESRFSLFAGIRN